MPIISAVGLFSKHSIIGWCCFKGRKKEEKQKLEVHDQPQQNIESISEHTPVPVHIEPDPYKEVYHYQNQPRFKHWPFIPMPETSIDFQDNFSKDEILGLF